WMSGKTSSLRKTFYRIFLLLWTTEGLHRLKCLCPPEGPVCAAGVSIVPDGCGCCKVCAKQLNEDCSETEPCDYIKGLECNFGGKYGADKGICRARSDGQTCEYNKKIYQNGEIFRPSCKQQCTCLDGAVGCVSLCPRELPLPNDRCPHPRLVKVLGRCCEQLPSYPHNFTLLTCVNCLQLTNDLVRPLHLTHTTSCLNFERCLIQLSSLKLTFITQTTDWSSCSRSCGTGVSTRLTVSRETQCKMVTETRICEVRPCAQIKMQQLKSGQKCQQMQTPSRPVRMSLDGCRSMKRLPVRFCGSCVDGRCCRPQRTQTEPVLFRCKNAKTVTRMVMLIQSCTCDYYCSETTSLYNVFNEVHKLRY
uniref:Cellular communication network factor 1 n=1 Tax=Periophthalmus magnuspinnatus TaxID=409849 RepID=A0A3B4B2E1_9GOBI